MSTNDNSMADRKNTTASEIQGEGDKALDADDNDTQNFIATHNVTKVARKGAPGAGEESADLQQADQVDGSDATEDKSSHS